MTSSTRAGGDVAIYWRQERERREGAGPDRAGIWQRGLSRLVGVLGWGLARVPPIRRALARSPAGRSSAVLRFLQEQRNEDALRLALAELRRARSVEPALLEPCGFWHFAKLAVFAAGELGHAEAREQVLREIEHPDNPAADGVDAARTLLQVSKWHHAEGRAASAFLLARKAVAADESWPESRVVLAWYGMLSGRFDPLPLLKEAIAVDAGALPRIVHDPAFRRAPGLVEELTRLRAVGSRG